MKRAFLAIALLAASWLPGIGYFHRPDALACAALVIAGVLLLIGTSRWDIDRRHGILAAILCAVAIVWIPWPYRAIPLLLACGLALQAFPIPVRWPRALGSAAISAGVILLAQSIALFAYLQLTARAHELPSWLAEGIVGLAKLIGIAASTDGHDIALPTMRVNHLMGATWELLIDPATLCFLVGGLAFIGRRQWRGELTLIGLVLAWLPVRIALLLALFLHRALRTDFDTPILLMNQFWSTSLNLLVLLGPTLLASLLIPPTAAQSAAPGRVPTRSARLAPLIALIGAAAIAMCLYWDPIGSRQKGRVMFDEYHRVDMPASNVRGWEPTDTTFDTESYGHNAAYTYSVLYNYLSHFYDVSRLTAKVDDQSLSACDVFILKVPTQGLEQQEINALVKFVARGGGLMLVGEHTDVFGTGTYLNDVARRFRFRYRYDCLFDIDEVFQQKYMPDVVPHPIMQHIRDLDYAVSCSIEPDYNLERGVIVSTGLRSLPADYHASNFYPQVEHVDRAETRYGSFVQLWAQRHVDGRVVAFSDSTEFSSFCLFDPGKSELFLGMTEWLNHRSLRDNPRLPLAGIGAIALLAAWALSRGDRGMLLLATGAAIFGWAIAIPAIGTIQKRGMPPPEPVRPLTRVVMDRTVCDSTLPLAGFIAGRPDGFGIFERWMLRLGYFTARRSGTDALKDQLLVFAYPDKDVPRDFREQLERYVSDGGKILVIDSAENQNSTANSVLAPFNIHFKRDAALMGDLDIAKSVTTTQPATTSASPIQVTNAVEAATEEGTPSEVLATIGDKPVSMTVRHGKGTVTVVGYGSRFSDLNMGYTGDNEPDAAMRAVYQVEFDLIRKIVESR